MVWTVLGLMAAKLLLSPLNKLEGHIDKCSLDMEKKEFKYTEKKPSGEEIEYALNLLRSRLTASSDVPDPSKDQMIMQVHDKKRGILLVHLKDTDKLTYNRTWHQGLIDDFEKKYPGDHFTNLTGGAHRKGEFVTRSETINEPKQYDGIHVKGINREASKPERNTLKYVLDKGKLRRNGQSVKATAAVGTGVTKAPKVIAQHAAVGAIAGMLGATVGMDLVESNDKDKQLTTVEKCCVAGVCAVGGAVATLLVTAPIIQLAVGIAVVSFFVGASASFGRRMRWW